MSSCNVAPIRGNGAIPFYKPNNVAVVSGKTLGFHYPQYRRSIVHCFEILGDDPGVIARKLEAQPGRRGPVKSAVLSGVLAEIRAELRELRAQVERPLPPAGGLRLRRVA